MNLEVLEAITLENRLADAVHARFQLVDGKGCGRCGNTGADEEQQRCECTVARVRIFMGNYSR